jgi:hypothetical protein
MRLAAAGLLLMAGTPALAQAPSPSGWSFSLEGGFGVQSETDLDGDSGSFDVHRTFVAGNVDYRWNYRNSVGVSVGGGRSEYRFYDPAGTELEEPWTDIDEMRFSVPMRLALGQTSTLFVIPTLRYNGERDASTSDSQTWGLLGGAAWRLSENLTIGPGLGAFSRLEGSTRVFPILLIDWSFGERWNLSTGRGLAASQGPGLTLSYTLSPAWELGLTSRYEEIQFRLDEEGAAPGGVGEDRALPVVFGASWSPNPAVRLGVFAGVELGGELTLYDERGRELESQDYDPSALYGATFEFNF